MRFGDADVAFMLGDVFGEGEKVTYTTPVGDVIQVDGIFDDGDQQMASADADVVGPSTTLIVATGSLPGLRPESPVSYAGVSYIVRDFRKVDDGATTRLYLVEE